MQLVLCPNLDACCQRHNVLRPMIKLRRKMRLRFITKTRGRKQYLLLGESRRLLVLEMILFFRLSVFPIYTMGFERDPPPFLYPVYSSF